MARTATDLQGVTRWQRTVLPSALLGPVAGRRSARDVLVDLVLIGFAAIVGAGALATTWNRHSAPEGTLDVLLGAACILALAVRRRHPAAVALVVLSASAVSTFAAGAALVAAFSAAIRCAPRTVAGVGALMVAAAAASSALYPDGGTYDWQGLILAVLCTVVTIGWGLFVRARRQLVLALHERAARMEAEQRLRVDQARQAERGAIAREMHDVLAHRVSLLAVHAGALEFRPDAPPDEIARAAGVIRSSAHAALQELREVVGVLREGDEGDTAPPQPTLARVPALVEESRAAGMRVTLHCDAGDVGDLAGRTAYRVVQEGLTNARKHAPGAAVAVTVRPAPGELVAEVVSRAGVGAAPVVPGTGTGLIGLAERVALAGGTLEHGPDADGAFVLRATLPLAP